MSPVTPTDQFAGMSLEEQMAQAPTAQRSPPRTRQGTRERALELQDILSAFHDMILPSEYEVETVNNLHLLREQREDDRTVSGNLERTLLNWGAYDEKTYEVLDQLLTRSGRARAFNDKLRRRFRKCYKEYEDDAEEIEDDPVQSEERGPTREPVMDARHRNEHIAAKLRHLAISISQDRNLRELRKIGEEDTLEITLEALAWVCHQTKDKFALPETQRHTRRSSSLSGANMFDLLIGNRHEGDVDGLFLLDTLESFSNSSLGEFSGRLNDIAGLLEQNQAPSDYSHRFADLRRRAAEQALMASTLGQMYQQPRTYGTGSLPNPDPPAESSIRQETLGRGAPRSRVPMTEPARHPDPSAESSSRRGRSGQEPRPGSKRSAENNNKGSRKRGGK